MTVWDALTLAKWELNQGRWRLACWAVFLGKISHASEECDAWGDGALFQETMPLMPAWPVSSLMWVILDRWFWSTFNLMALPRLPMPKNWWLCSPIFSILLHDYSLITKIETFMALLFMGVPLSFAIFNNASWLYRGRRRIRIALLMTMPSAFGRPLELVAKVADGPSDV